MAINGRKVSELGTKVNTDSDTISVDGKPLKTKLPPKVYWLLNKPDKHLTARSDELTDKKTIYDIPMVAKAKFLVNPVGRLDYRTEGLLLLTNDGDLSYKLCRPEYHVPREYQALLDSRLTKEQEQEIKKGITLEDGPVTDVKIQFVHGENLGVSTGSWYIVTVHEGRNRLVRRMFEHFGKRVVRLIRVGFGDIRLPANLPAGEYRQLTALNQNVKKSGIVPSPCPHETIAFKPANSPSLISPSCHSFNNSCDDTKKKAEGRLSGPPPGLQIKLLALIHGNV